MHGRYFLPPRPSVTMAPVYRPVSPVTGRWAGRGGECGSTTQLGGGLHSCAPGGPPASPWAAVTDATSPAHGLRCRPQQRGNLRPACASRWGPARSGPRGPLGTQPRGACRLSCTPLGVVSPTPPAHRSRGFGGVWGGVTQGASVAGSCPTAPQSWRPETPGQGVGRGGPFRSSEEASVPGPPPAPGDSRPPLASLASTSLPHGAGLSPCLVFLSTWLCAHPSDLVLT